MSPVIFLAALLAAGPTSSAKASEVSEAEVRRRPAAAPSRPSRPGRLQVELLDAETARATAGRVRVASTVDPTDIRVPAGAIPAGDGFFLADGPVRLTLPPGAWRLRVDGGPLRLPYDKVVDIAPGGTEERVIYLSRPAQYSAFERAGWVTADPLYSTGKLPAATAVAAMRAMGVTALGLDAPELSAAKPPRWARGLPLLEWRLSADPRFGSRCTLAGGGATAGFYVDCGRPRRTNPWKTLVPWRPELKEFYGSTTEATVGLAPRMYYELLSGVPVGGFELDGSAAAERLWFALLDEGWRVPAVAGSRGILSDGACPAPRMLLRPEGGRIEPATLAGAVRAGRSTLSFGPCCFLAVDKVGPGEELPLADGDRRILIRSLADTERRAEIARVELWLNGRVFKSWTAASGQTVAELELVAPLDEPGWVLLKCYQRIRATDQLTPGPAAGPETVALTNPIWIVPKNYRASLSPVKTEIDCRIVDAVSGQPLPATVVTGTTRPTDPPVGLIPSPFTGLSTSYDCPSGSFSLKLTPTTPLHFRRDGYEPRSIELFEELGLTTFARRLAALPPEKAVEELSSSKTIQTLRESMSRLDLTVRLQPVKH